MVAIYKVSSDYTGAVLNPSDPTFRLWEVLLNLERVRSTWRKPSFYVHNPAQAQFTDFYHVGISTLAFGRRIYEGNLGEILERCGEILPAIREDSKEEFYILNPLVCYNCLDREKAKLRTTPDGKTVVQIYEYAFHATRVSGAGVFRIPETYKTELFASSGLFGASDEFYHEYHEGGYTGLKFEKVWSKTKQESDR